MAKDFCHYCGAYAIISQSELWGNRCEACKSKIGNIQRKKGYKGAGIG